MDTSVNVDTSSRPAHEPATAPGRFVVRDACHEDLPEAAAVQAVCVREIGQGV
ncbi:GNAT family N-acetyltransferase, partial [Salmonella enterica subsp. enterica serovar Enteritidis]|nr:GNAT family N-acetyltransferase [Salmonella enterica subsp. enterica serovar Enteritidis]